MNNQTNPQEGIRVKKLFIESILANLDVWNNMLTSIGYGAVIGVDFSTEVITSKHRKADVAIYFDDKYKLPPIRVNIKSFAESDSSHLERRPLSAFCERNQIGKPDQEFLKKLILRKAKNSKTAKLVEQNEQARIREIFKDIEPGISALRGSDHPQILALYSKNPKKWNLYNMDTEVIPCVRTQQISFSPQASNIEIGDYVFIQRRASEGDEGNDPSDINHGSNNLQIKMHVKKFFKKVSPIASYVYPAP